MSRIPHKARGSPLFAAPPKSKRQPSELHVEVLQSAAAAHIQYVEIIDIDVKASVTRLARPELGVRITLNDISRLDEDYAKAELVVADSSGEICVIGDTKAITEPRAGASGLKLCKRTSDSRH